MTLPLPTLRLASIARPRQPIHLVRDLSTLHMLLLSGSGVGFVLLALGSFRPFANNPVNCYWVGYFGWVIALLTGQWRSVVKISRTKPRRVRPR